MLVSLHYYYGLPKEQKDALEGVLQGTITALFNHLRGVAEGIPDGGSRSFNDADYTISRRGNTFLYEDHSAGWWAVLRWSYPHEGHPSEEYRRWVEFEVFAKLGRIPVKVRSGFKKDNVPWEWLDNEFMCGRTQMYFKALRPGGGWSCPLHKIDLQMPLLMNLRYADDDIHGRLS